ncbi:MAG TPA: cysteine desulfurase [Chitinophagaceae bacterium]
MIETKQKIQALDVAAIRAQFPILRREVKGHPLIYLDNAATSQKPQSVIDALTTYYTGYNANVHRGIHTLAEEATQAMEKTRDAAAVFLNAASREEIVFTKGTTEGVNLVASTWGRRNIHAGDEIIISNIEHHSNIVPWQLLCEEKGATLRVIPVNEKGELVLEIYYELLAKKTKLVAVNHASNALGTINPVEPIIAAAHSAGAVVLIDGAQSAVHLDVDVQAMDCDFFVCSSHKMYGPTGVGLLYGKKALLEAMPPYQGGGEMIREVTFERTSYNELPYKFEAGTPNIADIIAYRSALEFIRGTGKKKIKTHEDDLLAYATDRLQEIQRVKIVGTAAHKVSVVSFVVDGAHPQDLGILLDNRGIAVRTGHHCAQPLMDCYRIPGTVRASFAVYNTRDEIDELASGLDKAISMLV